MSSTDRTDQYPEVSGEDAGLVPQIKPEWPKKIRTLTATELDRLTIDGNGRFYWDGRLVNYEGQTAPGMKSETLGSSALDVLDRAAMEISGKMPPADAPAEQTATTDLAAALNTSTLPRVEDTPTDVNLAEARSVEPVTVPPPVPQVQFQDYPALIPPMVRRPDRIRISLSGWQSLGLIFVILGFLAAAAGLAAQGLVAANEWGCRIGAVKAYCPPPPPAPKAPIRHDIPE